MESFLAWDGLSYEGTPPADWYLGQDGRWWPSNDSAPSLVSNRWSVTEGPAEGYLFAEEDGLRCVIHRGELEDQRFIGFGSILRVTRTKNTFGSAGLRIQTSSQTFEWGLEHDRDGLIDLLNHRTGRPQGTPGDIVP